MAATFSNLPTDGSAPGRATPVPTLTRTNVGQSTATAATCVPSADAWQRSATWFARRRRRIGGRWQQHRLHGNYSAPANPPSSDVVATTSSLRAARTPATMAIVGTTRPVNAAIIDAVNDAGGVGPTAGGTVAIPTNDQWAARATRTVGRGWHYCADHCCWRGHHAAGASHQRQQPGRGSGRDITGDAHGAVPDLCPGGIRRPATQRSSRLWFRNAPVPT